MMPQVIRVGAGLVEQAGDADEKICKVVACLAAGEGETAIGLWIGIYIHLFIATNEPGLQRVCPDDARKGVVPCPGIIRLREVCNRHSHDERIKDHVFDTFNLGKEWNDARRRYSSFKSLRLQTRTDAS